MPQRRNLTLSNDQQRELLHHRDHDPRPAVRERCAALLKVAAGQSPYAVARQGLLRPRDPDTAYGRLDYYQAQGFPGLVAHLHGGARRRDGL
jgi:hypothetical protein